MSTHLGPNIHAIALKDRPRLLRRAEEQQWLACLVMDDHALAKEIKRLLPNCAVVHRSYKEGDHNFHHTMTPLSFYDQYARWAEGGIIVQALNEPSPGVRGIWDWSALAAWCAALMDKFGQAGLSLALPNFGTGSPHESEQSLAALDPLWLGLKKSLGLHYYAAHGYGTLNGMTYKGTTGTNDVVPYRIGREGKWIVPYCQQKHQFTPDVILTEFGRDRSFYAGDNTAASGWNSEPYWSEDKYADELIKADKEVYNHPWMIGMCIFSYGNSGGWEAYDIEEAGLLHSRLTNYSKSQDSGGTTMPTPVPKPINAGIGEKVSVNPPLEFVNLRDGPATTYTDIGDVRKGQIVTLYKDTRTPSGWYWIEGDKNGWISDLEGRVTFEKVLESVPPPETTIPPPPPFVPVLAFATKDELRQLINLLSTWLDRAEQALEKETV